VTCQRSKPSSRLRHTDFRPSSRTNRRHIGADRQSYNDAVDAGGPGPCEDSGDVG
jgi:hypothetical protein